MELRKVILRYTDGRTLPAYAPIFEEGQDPVPIVDLEGQPLRVPLEDLKALFFVRTFSGNLDYDAPDALTALPYPDGGRIVRLDFLDGEHIFCDLAQAHADGTGGFFVTVLDPKDNNLLIYVNPAALASPPSPVARSAPSPETPEGLFEP